jgi:hypothetical protein
MTPFVKSLPTLSAPYLGRKGALCLFASLAFHAPVWAQDAPTLFRQMQNAEKSVSYQARQIITRQGERQVANVWRQGVKRRVEWLEPSVRRGDVLVDDGSNVWLYHRSENTVTQTNSRQRTPGPRSGTTQWSVKRSAGDFVLRNDKQVFVIDGQSKALLQVQRGANTWAVKNVRFGPVSDSQFRFRTPSGANVTRLNGMLYNSLNSAKGAATWLQSPAVVPEGYRFESAVVGDGQAWLRYSNGVRRFSLFQGRGGKGESAPQQVQGGWFWKRNGFRYLATGLPQDSVSGVAQSLK